MLTYTEATQMQLLKEQTKVKEKAYHRNRRTTKQHQKLHKSSRRPNSNKQKISKRYNRKIQKTKIIK